MKATNEGSELLQVGQKTSTGCYLDIDNFKIDMDILPDISDSKSVNYSNENAIGRSSPFSIFANGELRTISWTCHFIVQKEGDPEKYLEYLRVIQSACYPTSQTGHPPPLCRLRCGAILTAEWNQDLCCVLKNYSIKYDPNVPWHQETMIPYKMDIDLQFDVVYEQADIPVSTDIIADF